MFSENIKKDRDILLLIFFVIHGLVYDFNMDSFGMISAFTTSRMIDIYNA